MKKWKCSRCGYIHLGEEAPERCPVCGAPKEKFVLVLEETADVAAATETAADILVVGSGAAAFAAAITAKGHGASVIMLEKAAEIGGTTARSGGGYWIPNNPFQKAAGYADDRERCLKYMARYSYPQLYNPSVERYGLPPRAWALLEAYYDNAHRMIAHLEESGALHSMVEINWTGKPQVDYMDHLPENGGIRGRSIYPKGRDGTLGYGDELIRQLSTYAADKGVTILTGCEARHILRGSGGRVTGLMVLQGGEERVYHASKGVIFGSGGFSHDAELMLSLQRGPHFGGCSVPTNTGDFIRMAGETGAMLGNTAGAFRADSMIEAALAHPGGSSNLFYIAGDSVLIINKHGKRIVDEKRNYTDRAMLHFVWDAQQAEWVNMITVLLYDARTAALWQGFPPYPVQGEMPDYLMRADSLEALTEEIAARLRRLAPNTGGFSLGDGFLVNLKKTVADFNAYARDGLDMEFQRGSFAYDREWTTFPPTVPGASWPDADAKNYTMHPLSETGPYYAILLCAGTLDTNGGPVVDEHARVLDWNGTPIPGLYGAGNCIASPTANAYWGAGSTIGPAMTFGYLAALNATRT